MQNLIDTRGARILIVDDEASNVQLLEQLLANAGYTAVASTLDSREVGALHRANSYDLILLDLKMPYMDGFQVMEELKTIETGRYLSVLVLTAQPGHKLRALQAGAKDVISKPFDLAEVRTRIYNMLEVRLLYKQLEDHNRLLEQTVAERTAELRISEARFRSFTELSSDWYWEQDEHGKFTQISGPVLEMLGRSAEARRQEIEQPDGVQWQEAELAALESNIAARRPFLDLVYSRVQPNGSKQYMQVSGEPTFDRTSRFTGYRGIGMDITERMRPDESLRRFRMAMDSSPDAIFLLERGGTGFIDVNETACKMFGYTREEMLSLGSSDLGMTAQEELEALYDSLIAGDTGGGTQEMELRHKSGALLPMEVRRHVQRSGDRWIMVKVMRDLSKRVQASGKKPPA